MKHSILIVEDESEIADSLQYALSSEGMSVHWASTGKSALELFAKESLDLVILDVGLPDYSGFELIKEIRKHSDVPVIFLTARSEEVDRIVGLEIGADDYVTKPFSPREMVARVKVILRRSRSNDNEPVISKRFVINAMANKISYNNQVLELTKAEYCLLETLLEQPERVFSRRQLIEKVWSTQHPSDDRVIDTHVKLLRAKLKGVDPDNDPIVTHRGFGYSITL